MSFERDPDEKGRLVISNIEGINEPAMWLSEEYLAEKQANSHFLDQENYHNREMTWGEYCLIYRLDPKSGLELNSVGSRRVVEDAETIPEPLEPTTRGMSADDFQEGMRQMKAFEAQRPRFQSLQSLTGPHQPAMHEDSCFEAVVTDPGGLEAKGDLSGSEVASFARWLQETYNLPGRMNVSSVEELKALASSFLTGEILLSHPTVRDAINQFVEALGTRH